MIKCILTDPNHLPLFHNILWISHLKQYYSLNPQDIGCDAAIIPRVKNY